MNTCPKPTPWVLNRVTEEQLVTVICETLQSGLGPSFRCRLAGHPEDFDDWFFEPVDAKAFVLVHEGMDLKPCVRVHYADGHLHMRVIDHGLNAAGMGYQFKVPLCQPDAFEQIEARIRCDEPEKV